MRTRNGVLSWLVGLTVACHFHTGHGQFRTSSIRYGAGILQNRPPPPAVDTNITYVRIKTLWPPLVAEHTSREDSTHSFSSAGLIPELFVRFQPRFDVASTAARTPSIWTTMPPSQSDHNGDAHILPEWNSIKLAVTSPKTTTTSMRSTTMTSTTVAPLKRKNITRSYRLKSTRTNEIAVHLPESKTSHLNLRIELAKVPQPSQPPPTSSQLTRFTNSGMKFRSKCRCEKIWNCPKIQITVPRCPPDQFMCCF